jgi:hypothetical protein
VVSLVLPNSVHARMAVLATSHGMHTHTQQEKALGLLWRRVGHLHGWERRGRHCARARVFPLPTRYVGISGARMLSTPPLSLSLSLHSACHAHQCNRLHLLQTLRTHTHHAATLQAMLCSQPERS